MVGPQRREEHLLAAAAATTTGLPHTPPKVRPEAQKWLAKWGLRRSVGVPRGGRWPCRGSTAPEAGGRLAQAAGRLAGGRTLGVLWKPWAAAGELWQLQTAF